MKKLVLLFTITLILCGCDNQEKDTFKHYDLKDKDINIYKYETEKTLETYVLADITPTPYESVLTGLFYKVGNDDYILLETLESSTMEAYKKNYMYIFYENKLYGLGNGDTPNIFEIELNGKNSKFKELEFRVKDTNSAIFVNSLGSVDDKSIKLNGIIFIDEHSQRKSFICSLEDCLCEIEEN